MSPARRLPLQLAAQGGSAAIEHALGRGETDLGALPVVYKYSA